MSAWINGCLPRYPSWSSKTEVDVGIQYSYQSNTCGEDKLPRSKINLGERTILREWNFENVSRESMCYYLKPTFFTMLLIQKNFLINFQIKNWSYLLLEILVNEKLNRKFEILLICCLYILIDFCSIIWFIIYICVIKFLIRSLNWN